MATNRLSLDEWGLELATVTAGRGTCPRRQVGCVLTNARGHVLATGYNGVASGLPHCGERGSTCRGQRFETGKGLGICEAIHAEANALLQCRDVNEIYTAYVTTAPCRDCVKLFLQTSCQRIVFINPYAAAGEELWRSAGRVWYGPSRL